MGDLLRAARVAGAVLRLVGRHRAASIVSVVVALGWFVVSCRPAGAVTVRNSGGHPYHGATSGAESVRGYDVGAVIGGADWGAVSVGALALVGYGAAAYGACWLAGWLMYGDFAVPCRAWNRLCHAAGLHRWALRSLDSRPHGNELDQVIP